LVQTDAIVNPHARYLAGEFRETLLLHFSPKLGEIKEKQRSLNAPSISPQAELITF